MATSETAPTQEPEVIFDKDATDEQRAAVHDFVHVAISAEDEALVLGTELHDKNPELVQRVVAYIGSYALGAEIIKTWGDLTAVKPELVTSFDDATENTLSKDTQHQQLVERVRHGGGQVSVEEAKAAVRRSRFLGFMRQLHLVKTSNVAA